MSLLASVLQIEAGFALARWRDGLHMLDLADQDLDESKPSGVASEVDFSSGDPALRHLLTASGAQRTWPSGPMGTS
jgi:hypothetical protein